MKCKKRSKQSVVEWN
uniref:Uncharacterized protein n=1 Tax=Anguilla anguilla TaxID=7936 RepID=A0A0E9VRJ6_ANGAN